MTATRQNLHVHYSAEDYDRYTRQALQEYDDGMMRRLRQEQWLMRCSEPRLLDIGTGTARLLIRMVQDPRFGSFELIGTDFFEDMLDEARQAIAESDIDPARIQLDHNDVHDMPYDDGYAHLIASRSTIHHWEDPVHAFREIYRVLHRNGVAIIHEPRRDPHPEALAEFNRRRSELGIEPARMDEKYTPHEVVGFLKQAGIARYSVVNAPGHGPSSMGFEVRIAKSHVMWVTLFRCLSKVRVALQWL